MKRNVEQKQTAMKRILLSALFILAMLCKLQAQNAETHVTVHAGENALETLLTEEQKQSVKYLTVTGTLLDEDYAFLRGGLLEQLDTLDLRNAEIDTIPDYAFGKRIVSTGAICLILPKNIEYVGKEVWSAFEFCNLIVTGNYPCFEASSNVCYDYNVHIEASDENKYCTNIIQEDEERNPYLSVYSKNEEELYFINTASRGRIFKVKEGTRWIHPNAFKGITFEHQFTLVLPSSIDSIGDCAFMYTGLIFPTSFSTDYNFPFSDYCDGRIICESKEPPLLGKDVFEKSIFFSNSCLYVPKESLERYRNTPGWNSAQEIRTIEGMGDSSVPGNKMATRLNVQTNGENYRISSSCELHSLSCYDVYGHLLSIQTGKRHSFTIRRDDISIPYIIIRARFVDGTNETVKLIP